MKPYSLIIADIHLQPDPTHPINQAFEHFLQTEAPNAQALYILGDLFEMWVGDDIGLTQYQSIIQRFKRLTDQGLSIYLQYGNRDFLMREAFWKASGIHPLKEIECVTLYHKDYLILHGDTLCTDDKSYQKMRTLFRNKFITWAFLKLSQTRRLAIGQKMRQNSKTHSQNKASAIMDVNQQAVYELFKQYPTVQHMIHGHTHRPHHHTLSTEFNTLHRWVLGDWQASKNPVSYILKVSKQGPELLPYS
ncbi:UDP-2,3-diacylglucosamine diphosphatase [hydrothermal vent metagenome]|uniref:UDP-2,3-diacylglucosamine diphosphatase n=1 Tax=hydrothermal vent metagenome TaxID=652676 RepID=A0A3B0W0P5_9ZZZZ